MDPVQEVKDRVAIDEVVGRYVDLKRSGSSYKGLCPFHQEKTPSFYVSPARGTYHCFGCGKGGDAISFVMEMERLPFPDALKRLAAQAGVELPERERTQPSLRNRLYDANAAAARYFRQALEGPQGERARTYLSSRGFGTEAIETFNLGYAPETREGLVRHLQQAGYDGRLALAAGLALEDEIGGKPRDRFRGRLIFPILDASGHVLGFGGRLLGDGQPKYLNSPQTEIFDKSAVLFGVQRAQDAIRQAGRAVLVEGYLDAIRAHLGGYAYTVASLGTAVTSQQLRALSRLTGTVVLALDPDPAGQAAAARTALAALGELTGAPGRTPGQASALDLRVARLPAGHGDPDELIRSHPELWERALDESVPAFDFYFDQTMASLSRSTPAWRQEAVDKLLPLIQQFSASAGWQATWLERLAAETGIDPRALQRSLPSAGPSQQRRRASRPDESARQAVAGTTARGLTVDPRESVEEGLLSLLLHLLVIPAEAAQLLEDADLVRADDRAILDALLRWNVRPSYDYEMFRETLSDELRERADALRARETPLPDEGKIGIAVAFHLARLRHFRLEAEQTRATHLFAELPADDRTEVLQSLARLMNERHEVERILDQLSLLVVQSPTVAQAQGTMDQDSGRL